MPEEITRRRSQRFCWIRIWFVFKLVRQPALGSGNDKLIGHISVVGRAAFSLQFPRELCG